MENQQDLEVLLALKEEEVTSLRQQMSQLTADLKRNLEVLHHKDEDAQQLREAVDTLRNVISEKDALFMQFQSQVAEMEEARLKDVERIGILEQQLQSQAAEATQQAEALRQQKADELAQLQSQMSEAEAKWSAALREARQEALDEHLQRSQHQQSQLEWAAQQASTLLQEGQNLAGVLAEKEAELETANTQLKRALESLARMEETHKQSIAAKDAHIADLQERMSTVLTSGDVANADHENQITKLVVSMTQMKEAYSSQSMEVQQLVVEQKRLVEERRLLREQLKDTEAALTKAQTERGVLEGALQHEITTQATAQAELNIFRAKLTEAVLDLEQRCAAAESRAGTLMTQLVDERGRLVDAVIEQASSSSPALAAELTRSLEADRARTQAELQRAQERAVSLQEDLALIRSTLLPLLASQHGPSPGTGMAALTSLQQQQKLQAASNQAAAAAAGQLMQGAGSPGGCYSSAEGEAEAATAAQVWVNGENNMSSPSPPRRAPGASAALAAAAGSPAAQLYSVTPGAVSGGRQAASPGMAAQPSPSRALNAADAAQQLPSRSGRQQQAPASPGMQLSSPAKGGKLSHLVGELQADVEKLQQQLNQSRSHLEPQALPITPAGLAAQAAVTARRVGNARSRPGTAETQHSTQSAASHSTASGGTPASRRSGSSQAGRGGDSSLAEALQYLIQRTEQLSAENGALKSRLGGQEDAGKQARNSSSTDKEQAGGGDKQGRGDRGRGRDAGRGSSDAGQDCDPECDAGSSAAASDYGGPLAEFRGGIKAHIKPAANSSSRARATTLTTTSKTAAAARHNSSESEVLERILAGWPSSSKLSAVVRELVKTSGASPGDKALAAAAAAGAGSSPSLKQATLSAKAQLRRLAAMSPLRQRLDRML